MQYNFLFLLNVEKKNCTTQERLSPSQSNKNVPGKQKEKQISGTARLLSTYDFKRLQFCYGICKFRGKFYFRLLIFDIFLVILDKMLASVKKKFAVTSIKEVRR